MGDTRLKDIPWAVGTDGKALSWDTAQVAVLMDIRDELKLLNRLLHCPNFTRIPQILDAIRRNTTKPRRKKKPNAK